MNNSPIIILLGFRQLQKSSGSLAAKTKKADDPSEREPIQSRVPQNPNNVLKDNEIISIFILLLRILSFSMQHFFFH